MAGLGRLDSPKLFSAVFSESLVDALGALVLVLDASGKIVRFNTKCEEVSGRTEAEMIGQSVFGTVVPEDERQRVESVFARFKTEKLVQEENDWVDTQGRRHRIEWRNTTIRDAQGRILLYIGTGIDVTEKRQLQDRLLQSQKLESLGRLAGGIAHDYNNILTIIQGYAERAMIFAGHASRAYLELEKLLQGIQRCTNLTQQLLAYGRKQHIRPQPINLIELSEETLALVKEVLGPSVQLQTDWAEGCPEVLGDRGQLGQILMNLTLNARDSMPYGGAIRIKTGSESLDDQKARELQVTPGLYTVLRVEDEGTGIPPHEVSRIFEPFYTTKEQGKGTGLGLSVCEGIARQSKGAIAVESELGRGSVFKLYLPARNEASFG
jgi:two-component system cell cycle sensor histidine kinase/response regulator CckA